MAMCCVATFATAQNMRVMSFNVRNGRGMDNRFDFDRTAAVITKAKPDVVAVQELDSMTTRYPGQYVLGNLARRTKMNDYYAASIDYKGGKYGIGILSKEPAISVTQHPLPCRKEPRTMIVAEFEKFYFVCTHLSLVEEDQITSVNIIREHFASLPKPVIIAGDFNATPSSEPIRHFSEFCTTLSNPENYTVPADTPDRCIDYIMTNDPSIKAEGATVVYEPVASDHRPLYVDVKF